MPLTFQHRLAVEERQHFRKGQPRILHADERLHLRRAVAGHENGAGRAGLGGGEVSVGLGEGQVARPRALRRREAGDGRGRVSEDFPVNVFGDVSDGVRHLKLQGWSVQVFPFSPAHARLGKNPLGQSPINITLVRIGNGQPAAVFHEEGVFALLPRPLPAKQPKPADQFAVLDGFRHEPVNARRAGERDD